MDKYFKILANEVVKAYNKLCYAINESIRAGYIQKELYEEFMEEYNWYLQTEGEYMDLKGYMVNAYLLGDNLRQVIDTLEKEVKQEIPEIILNSCDDISVEYVEYSDESHVRIVLDCSYRVSEDIRKLLDDFCEGWYEDNHYDNSLSFCYDLNPENIEKFINREA